MRYSTSATVGGSILIGHISILPKNFSFYGLYEFEVCRPPIYFKAVGLYFRKSLPVAAAVYFVCLSRTVPKQYRMSILVVG